MLLAGAAVVGVGNIYASESLFRARINPKTPANKLSPARCDRLAECVRATLADALTSGGSTLRDYGRHRRAGRLLRDPRRRL